MTNTDPKTCLRIARAFIDLTNSLLSLSSRKPDDQLTVLQRAYEAVEKSAIEILDHVEPTDANLKILLRAPSIPLLQAAFDGINAAAWRAVLARGIQTWNVDASDEDFPYALLPTRAASVDLILYHHTLGLPRQVLGINLISRALVEEDPRIDAVVADVLGLDPTSPHYLIAVLSEHRNAIDSIRPGAGMRYLVWLEKLLRAKDPFACQFASTMVDQALIGTNWKRIAILMRIGADVSDIESIARPGLDVLARMSSNHGSIECLALEPNLADMLARPADAKFFGIGVNAAFHNKKENA